MKMTGLIKAAKNEDVMPEPTWRPHHLTAHGHLSTTEKAALPATAFAFPRARKEPMTDATHVRDALARFHQVGDVTDGERDLAFAHFKKAADHFGMQLNETDWLQLGSRFDQRGNKRSN
jgi:hypothetical protein